MIVKMQKIVEVEVAFVRIVAPVRYDDEDIPYDFPFRKNDLWEVTVSIDTGTILDWPCLEFDVRMKVVDTGSYYLLDADKSVVAKIEQDYVPHGLVPGSYGDYIEMRIAADGTVKNWPKRQSFDSFFGNGD